MHRGEAFAGGDGDPAAASYLSHGGDVVGGYGFFEPQWVVCLESTGETQRSGGGELAMSAEQDVGAVADGVADGCNHGLAHIKSPQRRLIGAMCAVRPSWVELHGGESGAHHVGCSFCCGVGIDVDIGGVPIAWVQIGVGAHAVAHATTQQVVHALVQVPTNDVPAGDLERAESRHHGDVGSLREPAPICTPEQVLHPSGVVPHQVLVGKVLDQRSHLVSAQRCAVGLAPSGDPITGGHFDHHEVPPAERGRRVLHREGLNGVDDHGVPAVVSDETLV